MRGGAGGGSYRDGMIAAENQRGEILIQRLFDGVGQALAGAGDFVQVACAFFAVGLLFRLWYGNVANIFHVAPELLQPRLQAGHAQRGGAHIDAAAARAQVHRYADDAYFIRHKFSAFDPMQREGTSRIDAIEHPWEGDDFANVLGSAYPGHGALQPQSEAGVRHAAVPPEVQIPLERFFGQVVSPQALNQGVIVRQTLAAADDFSVAFGRNHVEAERKFRARWIGGHVKRLHGRRIAVNYHRPVEFLGDDGFFVAAEVVSPLGGIAGLLENLDRIVVGDARKRRHDFLERFDVAFNQGQFTGPIFRHRLYDRADQAFGQLDHVFEVRVGGFGFEHPKFGQVPARLGFFGAERGAEGVNLAEGSGESLDVELAGLSQVGFLIVDVVHFEESGGAFARGGSKNRRVGLGVTLGIHVISVGALRFGADTKDGGLTRSANPQVPAVEEEIDAVFF